MDELIIEEQKPDHHFRTEIPNILLDILNPNQLAVYCHLKRIAGDSGKCWMSMKNLSQRIGMGQTALRQYLHELSVKDFFIKGSLIEIIKRKKADGSYESNIIIILDIWRINGDAYRKKSNKNDIGGTSENEGGVPRDPKEGTSPNGDKEERSEEDPFKKRSLGHVENVHKKKKLSPTKQKPLHCCAKNETDSFDVFPKIFDPKTYKLKNGEYLQLRTQRQMSKYQGADFEKLLRNLHWYENYCDSGKLIKKTHEHLLQWAIKEDVAGKERNLEQNAFYAKFMFAEFKLNGLKIFKTTVHLDYFNGSKPESISMNLPSEQFNKIIENYSKKIERLRK